MKRQALCASLIDLSEFEGREVTVTADGGDKGKHFWLFKLSSDDIAKLSRRACDIVEEAGSPNVTRRRFSEIVEAANDLATDFIGCVFVKDEITPGAFRIVRESDVADAVTLMGLVRLGFEMHAAYIPSGFADLCTSIVDAADYLEPNDVLEIWSTT